MTIFAEAAALEIWLEAAHWRGLLWDNAGKPDPHIGYAFDVWRIRELNMLNDQLQVLGHPRMKLNRWP